MVKGCWVRCAAAGVGLGVMMGQMAGGTVGGTGDGTGGMAATRPGVQGGKVTSSPQEQIATLQGEVSRLQSKAAGLQSQLTAVQEKYDKLLRTSTAATKPEKVTDVPVGMVGVGTIDFSVSVSRQMQDLLTVEQERAIVAAAEKEMEDAGLKLAKVNSERMQSPSGRVDGRSGPERSLADFGTSLTIYISGRPDPKTGAIVVVTTMSLRQEVRKGGLRVSVPAGESTGWDFVKVDPKTTAEEVIHRYLRQYLYEWQMLNPKLAKKWVIQPPELGGRPE